MCMSVGEHPKNEDLRVHRQPSEEVKNEQKESNKEFEITIESHLTELPPITYIIDGNTIKEEKTEEKISEKDSTPTPSSETQPENLNNESKLQEENSTKIENETTPKDDIKPNDTSEQKSEKEDKPSFRENMSEPAKGFGSKICSFFSTAIEVVKQLPQATREIVAEIKAEKEYQSEKERLLDLATFHSVTIPEKITSDDPSKTIGDKALDIESMKATIWKAISTGMNNDAHYQRGQDISDRVNAIISTGETNLSSDRPVSSPSEIWASGIVDRIPQDEINERQNFFNNFDQMYTTIEANMSNPDVSLSPEAIKEIEIKYIEALQTGSSYAEIHANLVDDLHTLIEDAYFESIKANA